MSGTLIMPRVGRSRSAITKSRNATSPEITNTADRHRARSAPDSPRAGPAPRRRRPPRTKRTAPGTGWRARPAATPARRTSGSASPCTAAARSPRAVWRRPDAPASRAAPASAPPSRRPPLLRVAARHAIGDVHGLRRVAIEDRQRGAAHAGLEHLRAQPRGTDRVHLLDHGRSTVLVTGKGQRETEGQDQPDDAEQRALQDPERLAQSARRGAASDGRPMRRPRRHRRWRRGSPLPVPLWGGRRG